MHPALFVSYSLNVYLYTFNISSNLYVFFFSNCTKSPPRVFSIFSNYLLATYFSLDGEYKLFPLVCSWKCSYINQFKTRSRLSSHLMKKVLQDILWRLLTRIDIILSTENLMLPIFWLDGCPKLLKVPCMDWCDNWLSAERSDLTADMCISAELSNS